MSSAWQVNYLSTVYLLLMWWRKEKRQLYSLLGRLRWTPYCLCNLHKMFPPSVGGRKFFCGTKGHSALCTQQRRQMLLYLWAAKEGRKEGGREGDRALCLPCFSLTPTLCCSQMQGDSKQSCVDLKITRQKWKAPFFSPVCGTPFWLSWVLPL